MDPVLHEITIGDKKLKIGVDESPFDPRQNDNIGKFVPITKSSRGVNLPDESGISFDDIHNKEELIEALEKEHGGPLVILPVYVYDHGNVALSTERTYPFNDPWDSAHIGYIFASKAKIDEEKITEEQAIKNLKGEVAEYSAYLSGQVYGFAVIKNCDKCGQEDEVVDSCYGFYDIKDIADSVPAEFKEKLEKQEFD